MAKRTYIGLATTFHDPAIAILSDDGDVLFAEASERYLQYKRAPNCDPVAPVHLAHLLTQFVDPDSEIILATSWGPDANLYLKTLAERHQFDFDHVRGLSDDLGRSLVDTKTEQALTGELYYAQMRAGLSILPVIQRTLGHSNVVLRRYPHHTCHAAYACAASPFEDATCLVVDGMGEASASTIFSFKDDRLDLKKRFSGKESIGFFFGMITELCGWDPAKGEEWKVMGLAPYGENDPEIRRLLEKMWVERKDIYKAASESEIRAAFAALANLPIDDRNIQASLAREGQDMFERLMMRQLDQVKLIAPSDRLVLSGGCALNSTFNGKVTSLCGFADVFVPSAPADDGNAIGAALLALEADRRSQSESISSSRPAISRSPSLTSPYLGTDLSGTQLDKVVDREDRLVHVGEKISRLTAERLAEGKLVGWVQGRAEFGPRALGNRSILADPRPANAKTMINAKVKYREDFRPFAPSILHQHGDDWFLNYRETRYMERTLAFRPEIREKVPAVVHADGTGRLQTVKADWNKSYFDLLTEFYEITSVPIVLNTSFNVMGKPILHTVEDALVLFYTTGLDVLVVGDYMIEK